MTEPFASAGKERASLSKSARAPCISLAGFPLATTPPPARSAPRKLSKQTEATAASLHLSDGSACKRRSNRRKALSAKKGGNGSQAGKNILVAGRVRRVSCCRRRCHTGAGRCARVAHCLCVPTACLPTIARRRRHTLPPGHTDRNKLTSGTSVEVALHGIGSFPQLSQVSLQVAALGSLPVLLLAAAPHETGHCPSAQQQQPEGTAMRLRLRQGSAPDGPLGATGSR